MKDFGRSDDPAVQAQLDRLAQLSLPEGRIGLETVRELLARLGNPQDNLPPVFHVAGTNGKGSVCAFLRAMLEADGKRVHVTTSPHLVRYNERIRVAGKLIEDGRLVVLLEEVLDAADGLSPSFFEVTIAAAFTEFARVPADACVVEVGLGGRFDATNVLAPEVLAACGIAVLGIDHERFLLTPEDGVPTEPLARIAFEKAGIAKPGIPLITSEYLDYEVEDAIADVADQTGAELFPFRGDHSWMIKPAAKDKMSYVDYQGSRGTKVRSLFPAPAMRGRHQIANAGLAIAMLRHQSSVTVSKDAIAEGVEKVRWPARMQLLARGPLTGTRTVWLDGGHNANAAQELWMFMTEHVVLPQMKPFHLLIGMIEGKDPSAFLNRKDRMFDEILASITAVPISTHPSHPAGAYGSGVKSADSVPAALEALPDDGLPVLIAGSLYLAGDVLRLNDEIPD